MPWQPDNLPLWGGKRRSLARTPGWHTLDRMGELQNDETKKADTTNPVSNRLRNTLYRPVDELASDDSLPING